MAQSYGENGWKKCKTLGGKESLFEWCIDEQKLLYMKRQLKNGEAIRKMTYSELEEIDAYVRTKGWTDLGNNVEKLSAGTEKEGLGRFMYELLRNKISGKKDTNDGQLASHLGALFFCADVWQYNGKKKGIQFKGKSDKFWKDLETYYNSI